MKLTNQTSLQRINSAAVDPLAAVDPGAFIEVGCFIGPRSVVQCGAHLGAGATLEADVVVGANATLEAGVDGLDTTQIRVQAGVRIGANATICAGVTLASRSEVRPGAVVTRSVPPYAIVEGNPATIIGYVNTEINQQGKNESTGRHLAFVEQTPVNGVTVHRFPVHADLRGNLTVGEFETQVPFAPQRYFMVFGVPSREIRGEHAHRACHQFLICVHGNCSVVADDGHKRVEVLLDAPSKGVYLPPMTWGVQYKYSMDAVLLVFASHHYDAADYIRDYNTFQATVTGTAR